MEEFENQLKEAIRNYSVHTSLPSGILAKKAGCSQQLICNILNDSCPIRFKRLLKVATGLGIKVYLKIEV